MPKWEFTPEDILSGKLVDPDWYIIKIKSVSEAPSAKGDSTNNLMKANIVSSMNGDTKFAGVPLTWNFNTKAPGFVMGFLEAMGAEIASGKRYELEDTVGMQVGAFVKQKEYEGRVRNDVPGQFRSVPQAS